LLTEAVYRGLAGERSVHLASWPAPGELPSDPELVEVMDTVRDVASAAHAVRKANGRRARLPLRRLTVAMARPERLRPFVELIKDEVNVKEVVLTDEVGGVADEVLTLVHAVLGPRLGPDTQRVTASVRAGDWQRTDDGVVAGGVTLEPGEYELVLRPRNVEEGRTLPDDAGVVTLDTTLDDELASEGLARDVVRQVQAARRDAGLHVADCITLEIVAPGPTARALDTHRSYVSEQTLAVEMEVTEGDALAIQMRKTPCPGR
jgi:isoleucyl-tRNA synthetase